MEEKEGRQGGGRGNGWRTKGSGVKREEEEGEGTLSNPEGGGPAWEERRAPGIGKAKGIAVTVSLSKKRGGGGGCV